MLTRGLIKKDGIALLDGDNSIKLAHVANDAICFDQLHFSFENENVSHDEAGGAGGGAEKTNR